MVSVSLMDGMSSARVHLPVSLISAGSWQGHGLTEGQKEEILALASLMQELEDLGACPVLNDGKVGGNCAIMLEVSRLPLIGRDRPRGRWMVSFHGCVGISPPYGRPPPPHRGGCCWCQGQASSPGFPWESMILSGWRASRRPSGWPPSPPPGKASAQAVTLPFYMRLCPRSPTRPMAGKAAKPQVAVLG